jgi:hypothetical protein
LKNLIFAGASQKRGQGIFPKLSPKRGKIKPAPPRAQTLKGVVFSLK